LEHGARRGCPSQPMEIVRINVDFNNCDGEGRVRLNTVGAIQSLNESQITLRNGLEVELTSGDFYPLMASRNIRIQSIYGSHGLTLTIYAIKK
jgi:hypothetical protein